MVRYPKIRVDKGAHIKIVRKGFVHCKKDKKEVKHTICIRCKHGISYFYPHGNKDEYPKHVECDYGKRI